MGKASSTQLAGPFPACSTLPVAIHTHARKQAILTRSAGSCLLHTGCTRPPLMNQRRCMAWAAGNSARRHRELVSFIILAPWKLERPAGGEEDPGAVLTIKMYSTPLSIGHQLCHNTHPSSCSRTPLVNSKANSRILQRNGSVCRYIRC